jgi:small conductance mechanosensitive channel
MFSTPPSCRDDDGSLCQFVWNRTHVPWLAESSDWLIAKPLTIIGIILLALFARWLSHRVITRATRSGGGQVPVLLRPLKERAPDGLVAATQALLSERRRQRAETIGSVLRNVVSAIIFAVAAMTILGELGIDLAPLLASAGIAGVALGFGAQNLVKDYLAGMFMILEDQYGVGDVVDLGQASGQVEAVGLRITTVRDGGGVVWYIRNGEVLRVGNRSQGWSIVTVDVPFPFGTRLDRAQEVLESVGIALADDPDWSQDLLEPPMVLGVEQITTVGLTLRITVKTATEAQWRVARELRRRVSDGLEAADIPSGLGASQVYFRNSGGPEATPPGTSGPT